MPFERVTRPFLDVAQTEGASTTELCLVDSGAVGIRLSAEHARLQDTELPAEPNGPDVTANGIRSRTYLVRKKLWVDLGDERVSWIADIAFCEPWPHPFGLLGQRGFFDAFDVQFFGREQQFRCAPRGDSRK